MDKLKIACKCRICVNLKEWTDEYGRKRYQCPYSPDKEWMCGKGEEPLIRNCKKYKSLIISQEQENSLVQN